MSDSNLSVEAPVPSLPRRYSTAWLIAALLIGALLGVGLWTALRLGGASPPAAGAEVVRFSIAFPPDLEVSRWLVSPEGATIAYVGGPRRGSRNADDSPPRLFLRPLNALEPRTVEGSEGVNGFTFSADGRWLAVVAPVAPRSTKRRLLKVPIDGSSPPLALLDWRDEWSPSLLWLPDGDLVVLNAAGTALVRLPSDGGSPREPIELHHDGYEGSFWLSNDPGAVFPDGVHVLGNAVTYSESGYETSVAFVNLESGESRILIENGSSPTWSPTGHLVFARSDAVLATGFDRDRLAPVGNTVAVQAGFRALAGYGDTDFSLSGNGTFLHWPGGIYGDKRQLAFVERVEGGGFELGDPWSDDLRYFDGGSLIVSDDGQRLAVIIANDSGLFETWISDKSRPRLSRFVYEPGRDCIPEAWTQDGESLIYSCQTTEVSSVYLRSIDSTEEPRLLMKAQSPASYRVAGVLPDESALVLNRFLAGKIDVVLLPLGSDADGAPPDQAWLEEARAGKFSPDGRWLAYISGVSGREEVYIRPLREGNRLGREIPISTNGGTTGGWEVDGSTLRLSFHHDDDMWSVEVGRDGRVSAPKRLGNIGDILRKSRMHTHLHDGRMMVALKGEGEDTPARVNVVLNWTAELHERLAAQ